MQDIKMTNIKLPKNWKYCKLGDLVEMQSGFAFKKAEYSTEGVRLFQIANVSFNYTKWDEIEHLPISYIDSHNHLLLKKGDIVLALNRPMLNDKLKIAELKQNDVPAILYQRVGRFIFDDHLNKRYFLYYFQSSLFLKWLGEQLQGVNIPFINKSKLFSYNKFPLPPSIETQQAIVSKIEELFSELDKGIEDLKTAQLQLKTYRQSILKWAFEGKLTNGNVKEGELPKGWEMVKIGEFVNMQSGVAFKKSEYSKEGIRLFQIANVSFNYTKWDDIAHLPKEYIDSHKHLLLKKGDIVLALNRPMLNNQLKIAELKQSDVPAILYQRVGRFTFDEKLNKRYFLYYFQSSIFLKWLGEQLQGVNIPFINKSKLFSYDKFPLPNSVGIQEGVIQEIESRLSVADKMEESIAQSLQQAEALRQSILKKAFSGELI